MTNDLDDCDYLEQHMRGHPAYDRICRAIALARKGEVLAKHIATQEHYRAMQERTEVLEQEVERLKHRVDELTFELAEKMEKAGAGSR